MNEQRFVVTEPIWLRLEPHLPGKASDAGATTKDASAGIELGHVVAQNWATLGLGLGATRAAGGGVLRGLCRAVEETGLTDDLLLIIYC